MSVYACVCVCGCGKHFFFYDFEYVAAREHKIVFCAIYGVHFIQLQFEIEITLLHNIDANFIVKQLNLLQFYFLFVAVTLTYAFNYRLNCPETSCPHYYRLCGEDTISFEKRKKKKNRGEKSFNYFYKSRTLFFFLFLLAAFN